MAQQRVDLRLLSQRVAAILSTFALLVCVVVAQPESPVTRVLFVGNSYVYFNNLPEILTKLAEVGLQRRIETRMIAPGGWRLKDHWEKGEALKALHESKWDYVVLQDQSTLGVNYYLEGKPRITTDEIFRPYAIKWAAEIRKAGGSPVFYLTWARRATPEDQAALNYAYMRSARDSGSLVAPVGPAWSRLRQRQPAIELFAGDGSHPSPTGSYLAALTLYATLFQKSPLGLPAKIQGIPVNLETARPEPEKTAVLVDLPPAQAQAIQAAAWESYQQLKRNGGYLKVSPVPAPMPPPLPAGAELSVEGLAGTWKGQILFYPAGPVEMVLRLQHDGAAWKGHLELKYNSKDFTDESFDLQDLAVSKRELTFSNPKSVGVDNLKVNFRGVSPRSGELGGIADTTLITPNSPVPVRLFGTWQLKRK